MKFSLNPLLEGSHFAEAYKLRRRIQVQNFLTTESAEAIHAILLQTQWSLAFNHDSRVTRLSPSDLATLRPNDAATLLQEIHDRARAGYQFVYGLYPLLEEYFSFHRPHHPLFSVFEFINSAKFLDFIRQMTGLSNICWADGQATCFTAGHFLKFHTDETPSQRRVAAYVLNLTPNWGRDWGGLLQFFNSRYDVEEALRPQFNVLNVFTIPTDHSVSVIAPYVTSRRLSITGWFREDLPPKAIGPYQAY